MFTLLLMRRYIYTTRLVRSAYHTLWAMPIIEILQTGILLSVVLLTVVDIEYMIRL
jgi:hypothetical protein